MSAADHEVATVPKRILLTSETILSPAGGSARITTRRGVMVSLFDQLEAVGSTAVDLASLPPDIAEQIPKFLQDFDRLRFLVESNPQSSDGAARIRRGPT
jgi:hypothetical protein